MQGLLFNRGRTRFEFLIVSALTLLISQASQAGVMIEPYVGYALPAAVTTSADAGSANFGAYKGLGFGGRLMVGLGRVVFVGVDGSYSSSFQYEAQADTVDSSFLSANAKNTRLGFVAGVSLPMLPIRFWLGFNPYDVLSTTSTDAASGVSVDVNLKGMSYKGGLGIKPFPFLSLNAEFIMAKYTTVELSADGLSSSSTGTTFSQNIIFLSGSIPIKF